FQPGLLTLPLATFTLLTADKHLSIGARRRSVVLMCMLGGGLFLLTITAAKTKFYWYAAPVIPLFSIVGGIGLADAIAWVRQRSLQRSALRAMHAGVITIFAAAILVSVVRNQIWSVNALPEGQFWYANFLDVIRKEHFVSEVTVIDDGLPNNSGFA